MDYFLGVIQDVPLKPGVAMFMHDASFIKKMMFYLNNGVMFDPELDFVKLSDKTNGWFKISLIR